MERDELRRSEGRGGHRRESYLRGCTAKEAWARMASYQRFRYPDLGQVFNL